MRTDGHTHEANFSQSRESPLQTDDICFLPPTNAHNAVTHGSSIEKISFTLVCEMILEGRLAPMWVSRRMYVPRTG